jgi:hypothetical protein
MPLTKVGGSGTSVGHGTPKDDPPQMTTTAASSQPTDCEPTSRYAMWHSWWYGVKSDDNAGTATNVQGSIAVDRQVIVNIQVIMPKENPPPKKVEVHAYMEADDLLVSITEAHHAQANAWAEAIAYSNKWDWVGSNCVFGCADFQISATSGSDPVEVSDDVSVPHRQPSANENVSFYQMPLPYTPCITTGVTFPVAHYDLKLTGNLCIEQPDDCEDDEDCGTAVDEVYLQQDAAHAKATWWACLQDCP